MGPVHKMADKFQSPDSQTSREEKQRREALTDGGAKSATDGVTHNNKEKAPGCALCQAAKEHTVWVI